jgi:hypothetical protein
MTRKIITTYLIAAALLMSHFSFSQEKNQTQAQTIRTWPQLEVERTFCVIDQNIQPVGIYLSALLKSIIIKNES